MEKNNSSKGKTKLFYNKNKKKLFTVLRILISIGLIVYLVKSQFKDLKTIVEIIKTISVPFLLASASMHIFGIWLSAVRWQILLKTQGVKISQPYLASSFLIGSFFNNFLPTSIGGDVFRSYDISKKADLPIGKSVCVIVIDRFSGVISAAVYAIIALLLGFSTVGTKSYIIPIVIFFIVCLILAFLILNPSVLRLHKLIDRIKFLHRIRERLKEVYHTFQSFKKFKLALALSLLCSLALQFAVIINYFLAAKSLGITLSLSSFIFIVPVVATISMLPISIGGTGIRENSLVFLMIALGAPNGKAAMCSLILLAMLLILGIIGGIILAVRPIIGRGKLQTQNSVIVSENEPK